MAVKNIRFTDEEYGLTIIADHTGSSIVIQLYGGAAHIGAVVLSEPRKSMKDAEEISVTSSVLSRISHKDEFAARPAAEKAARMLGVPAVCVAGIHFDDISSDKIGGILEHCGLLTDKVIEELMAERG